MAERLLKEEDYEEEQEEVRKVRHKISSEETFTLAKDVYDIRCFFMGIYKNRAVISRRLNIFSVVCSLIFTLIYAAYNIWNIVRGSFTFGQEITIYILLGVYAALAVAFVIVAVFAGKANTKTLKKYNKALKIFRVCIRALSIAMAIAGIVMGTGEQGSVYIALRVILIVFSVICIVIQSVPLIFGGVARLARWATSPAKGKTRFSSVILEWYGLVCSGGSQISSVKKVSPKYIEDIGRCIDGYLIPRMGKKYITEIDAQAIYSAVDACNGDDRKIIEGIFRKVFSYAEECGYVNLDITKDMFMEDTIDSEKNKDKKPAKEGILSRVGKKVAAPFFKGAIEGILDNDKEE